MTAPCLLPDRADYPDKDSPPEGWDEWRTAAECTHDHCAEVAAWSRQWRAEAPLRESLALARDDLDMAHADEDELLAAINVGLK